LTNAGSYTFTGPKWIIEYVRKHDVGSYRENSPSQSEVQGELDGGAVVLLSTYLTTGGHVVVVRGYTDDGKYIVNDPYGDKSGGSWDKCHSDVDCGEEVVYTWSQMNPHRYIALYGPDYLPDVYKSYYSSDGSTITIHNGAPDGWFDADVDVCLMNSNGFLNRTETHSIPVKGNWSLSLYNVFGWYGSFSGSAVVMRNQTAVSVVVENRSNGRYNNYNGISASGLDPGWGQTGADVYVPLVKYRHGANYYKWKTSRFYILNTGSANASITIRGYDTGGGNARFTLSTRSRTSLPAGTQASLCLR
jgi:hypothetical protein